jgi:hypothetical protein
VVLKLAGLLHVNCFHQIGMIAFIKLRHPLSFCRANCAEPWYLCVFVLSLSKNENNNGFDTIGLNSLYLIISVWRIFIVLLYFALFSLVVCFRMDENFA